MVYWKNILTGQLMIYCTCGDLETNNTGGCPHIDTRRMFKTSCRSTYTTSTVYECSEEYGFFFCSGTTHQENNKCSCFGN
jgi:hypothetical protein